MAIFSFIEIADIILMSVLMGYIFSRYLSSYNIFRKPRDYAIEYLRRRFNLSDFMFSLYVVVPAIVLHELGHKFVAIAYGYQAVFHSPISIMNIFDPVSLLTDPFSLLMIIALVSTYFGVGFLFFVPAFVSIGGNPTNLQSALIAFAGPGINMLLWLISAWLIRTNRIKHKYLPFAIVTRRINMLLFIFNMIPIPGFDGAKVFYGLFKWLFP